MNIYVSVLMWFLVSVCATSAVALLWMVWLSGKVAQAQQERIRKACE